MPLVFLCPCCCLYLRLTLPAAQPCPSAGVTRPTASPCSLLAVRSQGDTGCLPASQVPIEFKAHFPFVQTSVKVYAESLFPPCLLKESIWLPVSAFRLPLKGFLGSCWRGGFLRSVSSQLGYLHFGCYKKAIQLWVSKRQKQTLSCGYGGWSFLSQGSLDTTGRTWLDFVHSVVHSQKP